LDQFLLAVGCRDIVTIMTGPFHVADTVVTSSSLDTVFLSFDRCLDVFTGDLSKECSVCKLKSGRTIGWRTCWKIWGVIIGI